MWAILDPIFKADETYGFPSSMTEDETRSRWLAEDKHVFVAEDEETAQILGTYYLKANAEGPGGHVCNCGYAVSSAARGRGIATAMCQHSQEEARRLGFRAMQYNLVASTNEGAVRLWQKLGFEIVGTLPGAFRHPERGFVDAFVMFKSLGKE